jgi:hypothetical protein
MSAPESTGKCLDKGWEERLGRGNNMVKKEVFLP